MKVFSRLPKLKNEVALQKNKGKTIGFVPTMGFLHEGHLSLIRLARRETDTVFVSIFVNPLQFGPKEDFSRYPKNLSRDQKLLRREKVDFLFLPRANDLYTESFQTKISVDGLSQPLCGRTRPAHFSGVCAVVAKLLNLVSPDILYLGQKDYQQYRVIERMVKDLNIPVAVRCAPILREKDGLAMSSRNIHLSLEERQEALGLIRALRLSRSMAKKGVKDARTLKKAMRITLSHLRKGRIDYAEIVDATTLKPVVKLTPERQALAAVAVFFGKTRLIDNMLLKGKPC